MFIYFLFSSIVVRLNNINIFEYLYNVINFIVLLHSPCWM